MDVHPFMSENISSTKLIEGLSFIDWDELSEDEFIKLDRIINTSSLCSGVQFPFPGDNDKNTGTTANTEKVHHAPVFQSTIPPPPILGYQIPVHHWAHGESTLVHPSVPPYPMTVQAPYVFSNQSLVSISNGEATMTFVPAINAGQAMYALPAVPGHPMSAHFQAAHLPQSEPVDLSMSVAGHHGDTSGQHLAHPSNVITQSLNHPVIIAHVSQIDASNLNGTHLTSACVSHAGMHNAQVVYLPEPNILHNSVIPCQPHENTDSNLVANPTTQSSPIEFGGPVVFNSHLPDADNTTCNDIPVSKQNEIVNNEVVIDMESLDLSVTSSGKLTEDQEVSSQNNDPLHSQQSLKLSVAVSQSPTDSTLPNKDKQFHPPVSSPSHVNKSAPVAPVKMWSSLFGNKVTQASDVSKPTLSSIPLSNHTVKEEVKSIRYWQEKEKAEAKQAFVAKEKVIPIGPQNDPLAPKILEQLNNLPIVHTPIVIQPRGLVNGSNICFMNATLQVLMGCPPFIHMFRTFKDLPARSGSYSSTPIFDSLVQFVNSFQNGQRIRNQGSRNKKGAAVDINIGQPFTPTPILNVAQNILGLHIGVQHDAEEFLSQILMICHEELENIIKLQHADGINNNDKEQTKNGYAEIVNDDLEDDDDSWKRVGPKNHHVETNVNDCGQTPLSSIFAGLSRSCLIRESGKTSDTLDSFFTLKLDIQAETVHCVNDALLRLNSIETVHDADGGKIQGQRRMFFDTLPPVLILHLKLFQYSDGNGQKIQKKINFDVDLTIPKETLSRVGKVKYLASKSRSYKLFGVVNHHGQKMNDGHYTSDVYLPAASGWLRFDDSDVMAICEEQVLQYNERRMPYLLFYRMIDL